MDNREEVADASSGFRAGLALDLALEVRNETPRPSRLPEGGKLRPGSPRGEPSIVTLLLKGEAVGLEGERVGSLVMRPALEPSGEVISAPKVLFRGESPNSLGCECDGTCAAMGNSED